MPIACSACLRVWLPAETMTEKQLLESVLNACMWLKLLAYHVRDSRGSAAGFPDLVIAGPRGVIFRELKSADGETTAEQDLWMWTLCKSGADCQVWRPADWYSGAVRARLEQLA